MDPRLEEKEEANYLGLFLRFMGGTGMHGLPNIVNGKGFVRKLFWSILLLTGLGFLIYCIRDSVLKYYKYPTNTDLRIDIDTPTALPAITFCNLNPVKQRHLNKFPHLNSKVGDSHMSSANVTNELKNAAKEPGMKKFGWENVQKDAAPPEMDNKRSFVDTFMAMSEEERRAIGYPYEDLIVECMYKGKYCMPEDFVTFLNPFYGNCYTFNANATRFVHRSGASNAFALSFFIDQSSYVPDLAQSAGIRVLVHEPFEAPLPEDFGVSLFPGTLTQVGLRRKVVYKTSDPYGSCIDHPEETQKEQNAYIHTLPTLPKINYTQQACYKTCAQKFTMSNCGCMNPYLPSGNNSAIPESMPYCKLDNETSRNCADSALQQSGKACGPRASKGCVEQCMISNYNVKTSASLWPSDKQLTPFVQRIMTRSEKIMRAMSEKSEHLGNFVRENFARVEIYFEDLSYDVLVITPGYTLTDLLGDFGGQVGLWLGLSVLTIFEIVELIGDILLLAVHKYQGKLMQKKMIAAQNDEDISASQKTVSTVADFEQDFFQQQLEDEKKAQKEINEAWY